MGDGPPRALIRAAGAVLWRNRQPGSRVEVAVVHRPRYDDWSLPKGKANPGEHPLVNAVREVAEETGVRAVLGRPLGRARYEVRGRGKLVDYWAATPAPPQGASLTGALAASQAPAGSAGAAAEGLAEFRPSAAQPGHGPVPGLPPGDEVDDLEWLPVEAAMQRLTYPRDTEILREFARGPAATVPYIFLRHGSAGRKGGGPPDDMLRPLDRAGTVQAGELARLLACFGPARAISSATARCVETLLPYALLADVAVTADPAFTWGVGGAAAEEAAATARLAGLLADGAATIVCGHGETLPHLLARACRYFGAPAPQDPWLDKGTFWVLHAVPAEPVTFAALERHGVG